MPENVIQVVEVVLCCSSIVQLLEVWQAHEDALHRRQEAVTRIDALRERLFATYGVFPDSTADVREDRAR